MKLFNVNNVIQFIAIIIMTSTAGFSQASRVGRGATRFADEILEILAKGTIKASKAEKERILASFARANLKHGDDIINAARQGGEPLLRASVKHGDDVWDFAKAVPGVSRTLGANADELVPLVRQYGPDILRLEVKSVGSSGQVIRRFGGEAVPYLAKYASPEDMVKLLGYANKADSPATRRLLYQNYKTGGTRFLKHISWKHVMAGGLTATALYSAKRSFDAEGKNPGFIEKLINTVAGPIVKPVGIVIALIVAAYGALKLIPIALKGYRTAKASNNQPNP